MKVLVTGGMDPLDLVPLREGMEKTVAYFDQYLTETNQK